MVLAWWRRRRFGAAALGLYIAMAVAVMSPFAPRHMPKTPASDLGNHVSGIIEARHALAEGQFPIRVAPHQVEQTRYAVFQFYGNLSYTLGGACYLITGASPYKIWKVEVTAFLVLGAFFTYRCGRVLTRQPLAGIAAGAVFLTAPYVLTDLHGRFAFVEVTSFMLLPMVFYFCWRSFARRAVGPILACGVAWSCLMLTHNVTLLFAATYFGLFFLSFLLGHLSLGRSLITRFKNWFANPACKHGHAKPWAWHQTPNAWAATGKQLKRCLRVAAGFAIGLALTAWSIVPQQMLVPQLCDGLLHSVWNASWLTPLGVLLAPSVVLPVHVPTIYIGKPDHFGLQVGWPILAAVGLSLCLLRGPLAAHHGRRALLTRFLLLFGLAFVMTWTPWDFWPALPTLYSYVQFSYRLLMFVVLWGALLSAYALALGFKGRMQAVHVAAIVLGLGLTAGGYLSPQEVDPLGGLSKEVANPNMGRGGANSVYAIAAAHLVETSLVHPEMDWAKASTGGLLDHMEYHFHGRARAVFNAPREGDALRLEGTITDDAPAPFQITITVDERTIATPTLPRGPFELTIPLEPVPGKEQVTVIVECKPVRMPAPPPRFRPFLHPSCIVKSLALEAGPAYRPFPRFLTSEEVRPKMEFGHPTTLRLHCDEATLVQLPVVYYPGMQDVQVNGRNIAVKHIGRFVAVELPEGDHEVSVRFVGVGWANVLSLMVWILVATVAVALWIGRCRQRRGHHFGSERLFGVLLPGKRLTRLRRKILRKPNVPECSTN